MNKKYLLVVLAIVFLLWWTNKAKAQPRTIPAPLPIIDDTQAPTPMVGGASYITIQKGDTLYKLADRIFPEEQAGPKTKDKVLNFARQIAIANGFNWGKYDDIPSNDLRDPDTLAVGQKIVLWTWDSFNENNPQGILMPGQQGNAFNSFDLLT